ncbi:MAG: ATP-binding protein, partial [Betaproteobacteria bacterium]
AKVVNEVCAVIAPLARAKNIDIALTLDPTVDQVTLDRQRVKQSLFNLMTNAVKFSEAGGHIEVTADAEGTDRIRLQVRDTGIGIATHDLDKLFVEFQQLESGAARRIEGTGLGLVLTRKFVELQGGSVAVESTPGRGSVFTIVLPRHLEPATE